MQIDLRQHAARTEPFRSKVCIIGAGIAGLALAHRLNAQGIGVALLEAGGLAIDPSEQSLLAAAHLAGTPHLNTREGRFRAFGGVSLRWGAQLLTMPPEHDPAWPITAAQLASHNRAAEQLLAVDDQPYEAADFFPAAADRPTFLKQLPQLVPRLSKWAPFPRRNLAATLGPTLLASSTTTVYLHAQATELLLAPDRSRLAAVLVRNLAGHTFRFEAQHYVVAAGTVETSRLLLASRSVAPAGIGNHHGQVGRNFHDHLTLAAATFSGSARSYIVRQLRPWIPKTYSGKLSAATWHSIKLEASAELRDELALNPVLAHITFDDAPDTGLAAVRQILTARQQGGLGAAFANHSLQLPAAALEALRLAWSARQLHRRYIPPSTTVTLRLNAAQDAPSTSRITLTDQPDPYGLPLPLVDWRISDNERDTLRNFAAHLRARLDRAGLWNKLHWLPALVNHELPLEGIEDARHAMGGACMGTDSATSVVDPNLTVHGVPNLHIASAATYTTGTLQLITLPLLSLTLRLADYLTAQL